MDSVCRFVAECSQKGLPVKYIELNLSMKQCVQTDLTDKVLYIFPDHFLIKFFLEFHDLSL